MSDAPSDARLAGAYGHCERVLQDRDRTAWLATLFAPLDRRPALHALGAFANEIADVRDKVREALAGELRLQWWTEALQGEARGDVSGHPVATALLDAVHRYSVPRAVLTAVVTAHQDDLYNEPIESMTDFDSRADRLHGGLITAALHILSDTVTSEAGEAARHAGRLLAVQEAFAMLPRHRVLLPLDVLRAHGVGTAEIAAASTAPGVAPSLSRMVNHARDQRAALRALRGRIAAEAGPAFLLASLALPRIEARAKTPFTTTDDLPQWRRQWLLWRASRKNGIL